MQQEREAVCGCTRARLSQCCQAVFNHMTISQSRCRMTHYNTGALLEKTEREEGRRNEGSDRGRRWGKMEEQKKKEGMRRGKSYRKRKHRQYWWLLGWVCSKNWLYWSTLHCDFQWLQSKKSNRISQIWLLFLYGKWRNFEVFHPFAMNREWSFKALKRIIMCPIKN